MNGLQPDERHEMSEDELRRYLEELGFEPTASQVHFATTAGQAPRKTTNVNADPVSMALARRHRS